MGKAMVSRVLAACVIVLSTFVLCAGNIDLSGRDVPVTVSSAGIVSGNLETRFLPAGKSLMLKPTLGADAGSANYALLVPEKSETTVTVNGNYINLMPEERHDALIYMIGGRYLAEGENSIRIDRAAAGSWAGLMLFSLEDGFEEAHFHQAFGEAAEQGTSDRAVRDIPAAPTLSDYDVQWYDCTWIPSMTSAYMQTGSQVIMGARATVDNLQTVDMDFDMNPAGNGGPPMVIDHVDSGPGTDVLSCVPLPDSDAPRIRITLPAPVALGSDFTVRIQYHGAPNDNFPKEIFNRNSLYAETHDGSAPVVYSVSQAYGARRWWPCKDQPSDKATTSVQRIIVPDDYPYTLTAVSNGLLESNTDHGDTREYVWRNSYPIATYLMSMAISNYVFRSGTYESRDGQTQMPVGHYIYPEDDAFEGNGYLGTIQVMNFFADTFGEYPFLNEKYVTAAWNISWAIEHQTCTSMPGGSTAGVYNGLTRRNVHELAHQWFGDKVTMANWDQLWLNEGFATYCEALFFEHLEGKAKLHEYVNDWSLNFDYPVISPDSDEFDGGVAYRRGAWVLHMLRFVLGDEKFFQAMRDWAASGYTTALSQPSDGAPVDFQTAVEQSAGLPAGSMEPFFTQWLYSPNENYAAVPSYGYSAAYDLETSSITVRVQQTQALQPFQMPVEIRLTAEDSTTTDVRVEAGSTEVVFPLGDFVPVSAQMDADNWVLDIRSASITNASLPAALTGTAYSVNLLGATSYGVDHWEELAGTAPWISVNSFGVISGMPPAGGIYPVNVRMVDNGGAHIDASFKLVVMQGTPPPAVVINEVLCHNRDNFGDADYIELLNKEASPVDIGNWNVILVNVEGAPEVTLTLPANTILQPGHYYVMGNAATINPVYPNAVDLNIAGLNFISEASPGAAVLKNEIGQRVDSLAFRSDRPFAGGSETGNAIAEGGTGYGLSSAITATSTNATIGRLPDGVDTGSNLHDFAMIPPSPGGPNSAGVTLPFTDDFNGGADPAWKPAFQRPVRVVSPGSVGKPPVAAPAPAGGDILEVYDSTGGGDVAYLPGAFEKLNVEGYLWIPQNVGSDPWSTGVGIGSRVESAWFSSSQGFGLENGFYLEYQNGADVGLKSGIIPDGAGKARLLAADASACPGVGLFAFSVTELGTPATPEPGSWQKFRMFMDRPGDHLYAKMGDDVIYNGVIPAGGFNTSGGVVIGFRENHFGNLSSDNREGTWVDDVKVNTNTIINAGVRDYYLY